MISTHVLDTTTGRPAAGVGVVLERQGAGGELQHVSRARTDTDGRVRELVPGAVDLETGTYRVTFETGAYFETLEIEGFYPRVSVLFMVRDSSQHYHVPLLLSPYGYSTYRGS
ncbi:MAG: hydroxyisourate hydrolase [Gemmatimonadota bacterium]|nr:hydroxyisourate hydrolase [Gemmatimonadota bacterium]